VARSLHTGLLYRGQTRLHWRNESSQRRDDLVVAVSKLRPTGAIIIGTGMIGGRQERARRKCIEQLLHELTSRGIAKVVFERRHAELDARDRDLITALQRRHALPARFRRHGSRRPPSRCCGCPTSWPGRITRRDRRQDALGALGGSVQSHPIQAHVMPDSAKPRLPSSGGPPGLTSSSPRGADCLRIPE
jgi:hypothetical protein